MLSDAVAPDEGVAQHVDIVLRPPDRAAIRCGGSRRRRARPRRRSPRGGSGRFFALMLAKLWMPLLSLGWYWYALLFVLAGILPVYKVLRSK